MPIEEAQSRPILVAKRALEGAPPLLETISWPREVERRFFERHCDEVPAPISGRLRIEDVEPLLALHEDGLPAPPTYRPSWLRRWQDLLTHFAFTSFLAEIDLGFVAKRYGFLGLDK